MKSTVFAVVILSTLLKVAFAAVALEEVNPNSVASGRCEPQAYNVGPIDRGAQVDIPGKCMQASCNDDLSVSYYSCSPVEGPPGCRKTDVDLSKPYPDCCPTIAC